VTDNRDWSIARHRVRGGGRPVAHAVGVGLAVVAVLAAADVVATATGNSPVPLRATAGTWYGGQAVPVTPSPAPRPGAPSGTPTALSIPRISVSTALEALTIDHAGVLKTPRFTDAGWYVDGTTPGDVGPAVIAGHVDSTTGPSVFFRLKDLHPGDVVKVQEGYVFVNGQRQEEPYVKSGYRSPANDFPATTVTPGNYFVMGDHRDRSSDSRVWGFVARPLIKGRAVLIWLSYPEGANDINLRGTDRLKSIASMLFHLPTRTRWGRCFSLIH
jgi:hypothetical protein